MFQKNKALNQVELHNSSANNVEDFVENELTDKELQVVVGGAIPGSGSGGVSSGG